jgi:hypothetical protein
MVRGTRKFPFIIFTNEMAQFWPYPLISMRYQAFFVLVTALLLHSSMLMAQSEVITNVRIALKAGSSKEMVKYFYKTTDLDFDGNNSSYGKTQAEVVLKEFFKNNPPVDFKIIHQGASKAGSPYVIGQYTFENGSYRVWIRLKEQGEDYQVHAMSFYKD